MGSKIDISQDSNRLPLQGVEAFLRRQRETADGYRELPPAPDLVAFVACGWVRVVRYATGVQPLPVIPDGCADIITCDAGAPILVGPDLQTRWPALAERTVITGLRLRPGALRALTGSPAVELVNTSVQLNDVSGGAQQL